MIFANDFIGQDKAGTTMYFYGGDEEHRYIENLKKMPEDWYYRNREITYVFNSNGHRCKEIHEINLDNYILFIGCSHTEGIGLELEKTYPYLTSQILGCDYYNLAMGASGSDVTEYNLITWFHKVEKKPKMVVIQWPDHSRYSVMEEEYIHPIGRWNMKEYHTKLILASEESGFVHARKQIMHKLIHTVLGVPIVKIEFGSIVGYDGNSVWLKQIDNARDNSHAGMKSHEVLSTYIAERYHQLCSNM